ncbi:MAG: alpha/beta hydrolase, partial [Actinobacteria bacterium]|nr:alpha/beta hydrolase [Actinomycetota bacterium]
GGAAGAFLVAVPDPEGATFPPEITGFTRPTVPVSVPVLMVASTDDPYAGIGFSRDTAALLGADLVEVERGGHLSTASGRGPWPEGRALLDRFVAGSDARPGPPAQPWAGAAVPAMFTIQAIPKRSTSWPKESPHGDWSSGSVTVPPSASRSQ